MEFWYGGKLNGIRNNWQYTDNAKKYLKEIDKIDYHKGAHEAYKKDKEAEKQNWSTVEKNKQMKEAMLSVKDTMTKIEENTISEKSEAFKRAYEDFKKKDGNKYSNPEDSYYAFAHYTWREGNPTYDKAYSEYKKASKQYEKQLESQINDVIKTGLGNSSISKLSKEQISQAKTFVDQHIRFEFNK